MKKYGLFTLVALSIIIMYALSNANAEPNMAANNGLQILTTARILSVPRDWRGLKELFPEKKFNSFTPEKLEEFLKVVKADASVKLLTAPKVATRDGEEAVITVSKDKALVNNGGEVVTVTDGIKFKIKNNIQPDRRSINAAFELEYACGGLQKKSGEVEMFLPSNYAIVVRGSEPCDGNEIILIVQVKIVEANAGSNKGTKIIATENTHSTGSGQAENAEIKNAEAIKKAQIEPKLNWRQNFDKIYRLENDSVLKRIAPPFIPERREYYKAEVGYQASTIPEPPSYFTFHWDGSLKTWGLGFGGKETLYSVLREHLSIGADKLDVPEELMRIEVPGDWIVRKNSTVEQKLKALEKILSEEIGKDIRFEKRKVVRDAVVAVGKFKFHPPSETYEHESVHLYSDKLDADESSGGGTADSVSDFLNKLANIINMPVIDETRNSKEIEIPYRHHSSSYLRREKYDAEKKRKLDMLLANIKKQTELQFRIEKRPVEIWFVTDTPRHMSGG
ncbi:MAG: hypothetical protein ACYC54_13270 [Sedimentisphaerales bacterium]